MTPAEEDGGTFLNVSDRRKEKKARQKARKEQEAKKKEGENRVCEHFIAGKCRHGFGGDKPYRDILKCRFLHPNV